MSGGKITREKPPPQPSSRTAAKKPEGKSGKKILDALEGLGKSTPEPGKA